MSIPSILVLILERITRIEKLRLSSSIHVGKM